MSIYRLYIQFLFLLLTLIVANDISAEENYKIPILKKNNLIFSLDLNHITYINNNYQSYGKKYFFLSQFNNIKIGLNPFYKMNNYYLQNINIKFGLTLGSIDNIFFNNQSLILRYNLLDVPSLTLYLGYVIFSCYNFTYLQVIKASKEVEIKKSTSLGTGIIFGLEALLRKNLYIIVEYQNMGKYLNSSFDSEGISLGISYKLVV